MNDVKQVIIIRKDLKMRRGKEIAQGAHASIAWLVNRICPLADPVSAKLGIMMAILTEAERSWVQDSFRKITCVVNSEEELLGLVAKAKEAGLTAELIQDSGLSEFGGVPTYTAAAIGPDYDEKLDPVTRDLVLY